MDVIKWLLENDAPGVAFLARGLLLDEDPDARALKTLRNRCNHYPPVAGMLDRIGDALAARRYDKYCGGYWTLIFLADMQVDPRDKRVVRLVEHVLEAQLPNGGFSPSGEPAFEINCLTANVLRALVHCGYGEDPRVVCGYRRLMERIIAHKGVPCIVLDHSMDTSCKMTIPQTLRSLAATPPGVPKSTLDKTRRVLIDQLNSVRVYRYVRPDAKAFYAAAHLRTKGTKRREFKAEWLTQHKVENDELVPKPGWLRFGFPRHYNPDLLEAMLSLAENGVRPALVFDEALDHIQKKRSPDGFWRLDDSLNGKMLAEVEKKGRPSKWVTLRALTVLKHFGRVAI